MRSGGVSIPIADTCGRDDNVDVRNNVLCCCRLGDVVASNDSENRPSKEEVVKARRPHIPLIKFQWF
jgi:hypothetical protein